MAFLLIQTKLRQLTAQTARGGDCEVQQDTHAPESWIDLVE
jgi:hypothetical protein